MTRYIRLQSTFFIGCVSLCILMTISGQGLLDTVTMLPLILLIIVFGVPHGALDTLFASKAFGLSNAKDWMIFVIGYLSLSTIVLICWFLLPTLFFILFLGFSAKHFADDLAEHRYSLLAIVYGVNVITLPSIFYSRDLELLYGYLINSDYLVQVVIAIKLLATVSLLLTLWLVFDVFYKNKEDRNNRKILELLTVSALMISVKPLLAFTIYFCLMHSARHIIRSKYYFKQYSNAVLTFHLVVPTFATIVFCITVFAMLPLERVDENLIKVTFGALAALTFPHDMLLNKVGFKNWFKSHPC